MDTKRVLLVGGIMIMALCSVPPISGSKESVQGAETYSNFAVEAIIRDELRKLRSHPYINPSIDIASIKIPIDVGDTSLRVSMTNAEVIGIKDFLINKCVFEGLTEGRIDLTLMFPEVIILGTNYKINGLLAGLLPMHSDGPFEIKISNMNLTAWGNVFINPSGKLIVPVKLEDVEADIHIGSLNVNMVNILGELSDEFNLMLSEIGIDLITPFKPQIDAGIAKYLERVLNNILNKSTILQGNRTDMSLLMQKTMEDVVSGIMNGIIHSIHDPRNVMPWA